VQKWDVLCESPHTQPSERPAAPATRAREREIHHRQKVAKPPYIVCPFVVVPQRKTQFVTFRGNKRQAQTKLAELIAAVAQEKYVEPSKVTVAQYVRDRVDRWESAGDISARTAARYRELVENQIVPHIGAKMIQKLRTTDIEDWHATLRTSGRTDGKGGLTPRTIGHAHRVLGKGPSRRGAP
jgi:hypothetical protein